MQIIRDAAALRAAVAGLRQDGARIALVPTMGALHAGHLALVQEARRRGARIVASIFVNPKQFGAGEDLDRYPRREASDAALLDAADVDVLWAPDAATMYPPGFATTVSVAGVTERWDGAARPGHFDGVATVVLKLFNQVAPDLAIFGEKDFQQLAAIRRMACDLDLPIEVVGVPTQREDDGLALSSRNVYLTPDQRLAARALPRALGEAAVALGRGGSPNEAFAAAERRLRDAGFQTIDYLALVEPVTLEPTTALPARLIVAAKLGTTRLIDNLTVDRPS